MLKVLDFRVRELQNQIRTMNRILREYPDDVLEKKRLRKQYFSDAIYRYELENRLLVYMDNPEIQGDSRDDVRENLQRLYETLDNQIAQIHDSPCDLSDGARELAKTYSQSECDLALAILDR